MDDLWHYIAISTISILIGGAPSHFYELRQRPTRKEVSRMIEKEAPISIKEDLKEIKDAQNEVIITQTKICSFIENFRNAKKK